MAFKQLSYAERLKIEALFSARHKPQEIARLLHRSSSTIYRELVRGRYERLDTNLAYYTAYSADIAQDDRDFKASAKGPGVKLGKDFAFVEYIEDKILKDRYSPAAALAALAYERPDIPTRVCVKTLYNYIGQGLFLHVTNQDLWRHGERKQKYDRVRRTSTRHPLDSSIEERPAPVNARREEGHWEMDTVYGKAEKGETLLVLTERVLLKQIVIKIKSRTQREVLKALDRLERKYGAAFYTLFRSITVDNGSEFLDCEGIERSCRRKGKRTKVYYCHPYSSWERGSNENANSIIRRFIPKGAKIEDFSKQQIRYIENWMNNYPRKVLGYRTPDMLFNEFWHRAAHRLPPANNGRPSLRSVQEITG